MNEFKIGVFGSTVGVVIMIMQKAKIIFDSDPKNLIKKDLKER